MEGFEELIGVNFWTALFTFCNMIITFLLLKKFLFKPVKKMIDERQKEIDELYANAEKQTEEAKELQAQYQERLDSARREREDIITDATKHAERRGREIVTEAQADAVAIRQKAEAEIAQERKRALNQMKGEISGIAMEIASKVVDKELNESDHMALVEEFIGKIGDEI